MELYCNNVFLYISISQHIEMCPGHMRAPNHAKKRVSENINDFMGSEYHAA